MPGRRRNISPGAHARRYIQTCGEKQPLFDPSMVLIPAARPGQPTMTAEHAMIMGRIFAQENMKELQGLWNALGDMDKLDGIPVTKAFTGITVEIGTNPVRIIAPETQRPYLLLNPAIETTGQTASDTISAVGTSISADANTADINVAGVEDVHIFFNPTAISGSWSVFLQAKDPVTGGYADTQKLFDTDDAEIVAGGGPYYAYVGSLGIPGTTRFRFVEDAAGTLVYSLGIVRKKNVGQLDISAGVPLTIYLGNSGVTTVSGYPLLEGEERFFIIDQNVELYGVAQATVSLKLFQLEA